MQAYVKEKNNSPPTGGTRMAADEVASLKVPMPDIERLTEHKRRRSHKDITRHDSRRHRSSKDSKATKGIGRDADMDGVEDTVADNMHGTQLTSHDKQRSQLPTPHSSTTFQQLDPDDMPEFEDIDDLAGGFQYQPMGDQQAEAMRRRLVGGIAYKSIDKYIEGDSYPDTTSGRLSDDGLVHEPEDYSVRAVQDTVVTSIAKSQNGTGHASTKPKRDVDSYSKQQPFFQRPDSAAFESMPAFQMPMARRGSANKNPQPPHDNRPRAIQVIPSQQPKPSHVPPRAHQAEATQSFSNNPREQHLPTPVVPEPSSDGQGEEYTAINIGQAHGLEDVELAESPLLDHDLETLHKMEYKQLKEEQFDHDPRAEASTQLAENESLSNKLQSLAELSPAEWSDFFYSLDIKKWEDAGDWFVDQFSSVLAGLKDIRRQRRNAAQAFELEVEHRQQAIVKKRITIRNTMENMRTHGAQVLVTPMKAAAA